VSPRAARRLQGERQQPDPAEAQQGERVEVLTGSAQAPVQAGGLGAPGVAAEQGADRLSGAHPVAGSHRRDDRLVGGAQAARVRHADHATAGDEPGVVDDPGAGSADGGARCGGKVDTAVASQPGLGRRVEVTRHARRPVERPAPVRPGGPKESGPARSLGGPKESRPSRSPGGPEQNRPAPSPGRSKEDWPAPSPGRSERKQCSQKKTHAGQPAPESSAQQPPITRPVENRGRCGKPPRGEPICYGSAAEPGLGR
jgi:hypothetical protein